MAETKEFTSQEVSSHNTKKDLYMIIHEKVYDVSSFVDEHPYVSSFSQITLNPLDRCNCAGGSTVYNNFDS